MERFGDSGSSSEDDQDPVWRLIPNADALQTEMTRMVQVNVELRHGLMLGAEGEAADRTES